MTTAQPGANDQSGFEWPTGPQAPQQTKPRKTALFVSLALVAALAIGGGAFAVVRALSGGGAQPADALPESTMAYARLDIDPSAGQKLAAVQFLQGLDPETRDILSSSDPRAEFFNAVAASEPGLSHLDFETDIEPWLGDRLGVGLVPDPDSPGDPIPAIVVQVDDEQAADESLTTIFDQVGAADAVGWYFHGDYVVFSAPDRIDTLETMVGQGTLSDSSNFVADHDALGDHGVASAWVDLDVLTTEMNADVPDYYDDAYGLGPGGMFGAADDVDAGRMAMALRLGNNHIEVHGIAHGHAESITAGSSPALITELPADTSAALSVEHGDQWVNFAWNTMSEIMPAEAQQMQEEARIDGFEIPEDIATIVGQSAVIATGPNIVESFDTYDSMNLPEVAVRVSTSDVDRASSLVQQIAGHALHTDELTFESSGNSYTVGGDREWTQRVGAGGGGLGDTELFQSAVPHAAGADMVGYVDLTAFEAELSSISGDQYWQAVVRDLGAVGFSATVNGSSSEFTMRLVGQP